MKRIILIYGLISGIIIAIFMQIQFSGMLDNMTYGELFGYSSMVISFSIIFVAVKKYRDTLDNQKISFLQSFLIGLGISLIATLFYVVSWGFIDGFTNGSFLDTYEASTMKALQEENASSEKIAEAKESMEYYRELYKNPITKAAITAIEIFPVGLLITIITSLFFWIKDKDK